MYINNLDPQTKDFISKLIDFFQTVRPERHDIIINKLTSIIDGGESDRVLDVLRAIYLILADANANLFEEQKEKLLKEMVIISNRFKSMINEINALDETDKKIINECIKNNKTIDSRIGLLEAMKERVDDLVFKFKFENEFNRLKKIKEIENKYGISLFDFAIFQKKKAMNWYKRVLGKN